MDTFVCCTDWQDFPALGQFQEQIDTCALVILISTFEETRTLLQTSIFIMPGVQQSPCMHCVQDLPPEDPNGDFTELSDLLYDEDIRDETLTEVSNISEWRHLQHLRVQARYRGVIIAMALDAVDSDTLPLNSPPPSPTQQAADEEYGGRYYGEDWVLYGSRHPQEVLVQVNSQASYQKWLDLHAKFRQLYEDIKQAIINSEHCPRAHACHHTTTHGV